MNRGCFLTYTVGHFSLTNQLRKIVFLGSGEDNYAWISRILFLISWSCRLSNFCFLVTTQWDRKQRTQHCSGSDFNKSIIVLSLSYFKWVLNTDLYNHMNWGMPGLVICVVHSYSVIPVWLLDYSKGHEFHITPGPSHLMNESDDLSLMLQISSVAIGWSKYFDQWDLDLFQFIWLFHDGR